MGKVEITPQFRVSYPSVFKAKINTLSNQEEYSVTALFDDKANLDKLKKLAEEALVKKWGKDKNAWPKALRSPFRDQAEREKSVEGKMVLPAGYKAGNKFVTLKSRTRPGVVDQNVQPILDETQFYAGCFAIAAVEAYAYDNKGNRGVAFALKNIQKVADGDPLAGGPARPEDHFSPVASDTTAEVTNTNDLFN